MIPKRSFLAVSAASLALVSSAVAQDYVSAGTIPSNHPWGAGFFRADLDRNGVDDLMFDAFNYGVSVWMNPGFGATSANPTLEIDILSIDPFGGWFEIKDIVDVDGDGFLDVAGKYSGVFSAPYMLYCPGDGLGGFGAPVSINSLQGKVTYGDFGDFNGDGRIDAVSSNIPFFGQGPSDFVFYTQSASGGFTLAHTEPHAGAGQVFAGDFNGDGFDDAAWIENGMLEILPGGATGFGTRQNLPIPAVDDGMVYDLDRDGYDDIVLHDVIGGSTSNWQVHVVWGDPNSFLGGLQTVVAPGNGFGDAEYVGPFDIDGDGNIELLFVIRNTTGFVLVRQDGARNFSPAAYETTTFGGQIDLDQDGDLDQVALDSIQGIVELRENIAVYGAACAGAAGEPALEIGAAIPGSATFYVAMTNAAAGVPAEVFLSAAPVDGPCGPQVDFGQVLIPGPGAPLFAGLTDSAGRLSVSLPIPLGLPPGPYFFQGVALDPSGAFNLAGYSLSATKGRAVRVY